MYHINIITISAYVTNNGTHGLTGNEQFQGVNVPGSEYSWVRKFQKTKVPGPFRSGEQKFQGVRRPGSLSNLCRDAETTPRQREPRVAATDAETRTISDSIDRS